MVILSFFRLFEMNAIEIEEEIPNHRILPNVDIVENPIQQELIIGDADPLQVHNHLRVIGVQGKDFKLISNKNSLCLMSKMIEKKTSILHVMIDENQTSDRRFECSRTLILTRKISKTSP